jgi:hypothetical protein
MYFFVNNHVLFESKRKLISLKYSLKKIRHFKPGCLPSRMIRSDWPNFAIQAGGYAALCNGVILILLLTRSFKNFQIEIPLRSRGIDAGTLYNIMNA